MYNGKKEVHVVAYDVIHKGDDVDYEMEEQAPLQTMINRYLEEADESKSQDVPENERQRLLDFAVYLQHIDGWSK